MARRELDEWFWHIGTELQRLTDEAFRSRPSISGRRFWEPRVDVLEDDRCLIVKVELAGVRGEDIHLVYNGERHTLVVRGYRHEEECTQNDQTGCFQLEIFYGEFEREVHLPDIPLDPEGITARCRGGMLQVLIPKQDGTEHSRTITITE
jgi:HSP20 family protein